MSKVRKIKQHVKVYELCIFDVFVKTSFQLHAFLQNRQQRWSRGHKVRGQGQGHNKNPRPRPRTAFPRTDTLEAKDRNARGQGQGPRTQAQVLPPKKKLQKKKVFTKIFQAISTKKRFSKNFSSAPQNFNNSKNTAVLLSSSQGQANFRGLEASRPRPRTSKCVLEDLLEAKDVLEDSTSDRQHLDKS